MLLNLQPDLGQQLKEKRKRIFVLQGSRFECICVFGISVLRILVSQIHSPREIVHHYFGVKLGNLFFIADYFAG